MHWIIYAIAFVLLYVIQALISKKILSDKADYDHIAYAVLFNGLIGLMALAAYLLIIGFQTTDLEALMQLKVFGLLGMNVVLYSLSGTFYYYLLKKVSLAELTVLYSTTGIWASRTLFVVKTT